MLGSRINTRGSRWLALAVTVLLTALCFSVFLNSGAPGQRVAGGGQAPPSSVDAPGVDARGAVAGEVSLVERVLADLRAGRRPESQDRPLAGAPVRLVRAGPDDPAPIGQVRIAAIGLRAPVFEGVYEGALVGGPGHWPGTPGFGEAGNTVISGHRSTETRPFLYLDRLGAGDVIAFRRGSETFRYAVDTVTIVAERRYVPYVLKQPVNPRARRVTLFACNPLTAHYQRIVVRAHAIGSGRSA